MKFTAGLVSAILVLQVGCSDNAIRLRFGIEAAASRLAASPDFTEERVRYVPVAAPAKGYWLIFFPDLLVRKQNETLYIDRVL